MSIKVVLSKKELSSAKFNASELYPKCFQHSDSFDRYFTWCETRQGFRYWENKLGDMDWWNDRAKADQSLKANLSQSDKIYLFILMMSRQNKIGRYIFSDKASEMINF